ncbi:hypothetical protein RB9752 [Rhodopirellula baltica SH 1]|uniref:Uncharacterized protein n=1 Tax=Rhodopirellula baltica (strain DSM 10527 / NCIMB 13988 / SH1) TaxID=243090 RepID=Q7UL41_RHOBA|nr:hypothetical protein RB9752 [Rhodopirellula baltica SH 1]
MGGQFVPFPMLGPHPRVRLNGVARPLPKLCFRRGASCGNPKEFRLTKLHDLLRGRGFQDATGIALKHRANECALQDQTFRRLVANMVFTHKRLRTELKTSDVAEEREPSGSSPGGLRHTANIVTCCSRDESRLF